MTSNTLDERATPLGDHNINEQNEMDASTSNEISTNSEVNPGNKDTEKEKKKIVIYKLDEILTISGANPYNDHNIKDKYSKAFRALLNLAGAKEKWFLSEEKKGFVQAYCFYNCDSSFFKFIHEFHTDGTHTFNKFLKGKFDDINVKNELRQKAKELVITHLKNDEYFKKIYDSIKNNSKFSNEDDKTLIEKTKSKIESQISKVENYKKDSDSIAIEKDKINKKIENELHKLLDINIDDKQHRLTDDDKNFLYEQYKDTLFKLEPLFEKISSLRKKEYKTLFDEMASDENYSFYIKIKKYLEKNKESSDDFFKNENSKRTKINKEYSNYLKIIEKYSKKNDLDKKIEKNLEKKRFSYKTYQNISKCINENANDNLKTELKKSNDKLQRLISEYIKFYNSISRGFGKKMLDTKNIKRTYSQNKKSFKEAIYKMKKSTEEILSQNSPEASL